MQCQPERLFRVSGDVWRETYWFDWVIFHGFRGVAVIGFVRDCELKVAKKIER